MVYVLGIGNVLMGDDGFGPAAVRAFEAAHDTGADVEVVDVGTPGLDLMPWFCDADALIIVDTVKSDAPPGTIRIYDKPAILEHAPAVRVGPHDPGVKDALHAVEFAGRGPRAVTLVGVVPQHVGMSTDLSQPVRDAIPAAVAAVAHTLVEYGQAVTRRAQPAALSAWWTTGQL
jgi:hydrogenase maturation protease